MAQAVCAVRPIRKITAYSRDPENVRRFCDAMQSALGIEVLPAASGREAVKDADIMITATSGNTIVFEGTWLEPGALYMSLAPGECDEKTILRSRVFLSGTDQVFGDSPPRKPFNTLVASGKFGPEKVAAEFCDVVTGEKTGRQSEDDIIFYQSPGMGILDAGIGHWVYDRARQNGLGTELPFGVEER
jgi:ornithine cyclodeaminase/alanine dehydrogenase-like protein (mu-crystallin family)